MRTSALKHNHDKLRHSALPPLNPVIVINGAKCDGAMAISGTKRSMLPVRRAALWPGRVLSGYAAVGPEVRNQAIIMAS